jgi:hypothetical protein
MKENVEKYASVYWKLFAFTIKLTKFNRNFQEELKMPISL